MQKDCAIAAHAASGEALRRCAERMIRLVSRIGLLLLIGAIINLAVDVFITLQCPTGWFFAYGVTSGGWNPRSPVPGSVLPNRGESVNWMIAESKHFGALDVFTCTDFADHRLTIGAASAFSDVNQAMMLRPFTTERLPNWCFAQRSSAHFAFDEPFTVIDEGARGWPMLSFRYEVRDDLTNTDLTAPIANAYGDLWSSNGHIIPGYPIAKGVAFNTLFYAVIVWLLCFAPFDFRRLRRSRRGLCVRCGYPVGTSDICSECGAQVHRSATVHGASGAAPCNPRPDNNPPSE